MEAADALGLTPEILTALDAMALPSRRPLLGTGAGGRRSRHHGSSTEFSDFRSYVAGDDVRRIDWNAYARLDRLLIRLTVAEEDVCVTTWVDTSASMAFGQPAKLACARGLAGAIAYLAAGQHDRFAAVGFAGEVTIRTGVGRGRHSCHRLWSQVLEMHPHGDTDFAVLARNARLNPRGIAVVISDFLTESDPSLAVAALRSSGSDVVLVHVLGGEDLHPAVRGDVALRDAETTNTVDVAATSAVVAAYRDRLDEHCRALQRTAGRQGCSYVLVDASMPLRDLLLGTLRHQGVIR